MWCDAEAQRVGQHNKCSPNDFAGGKDGYLSRLKASEDGETA